MIAIHGMRAAAPLFLDQRHLKSAEPGKANRPDQPEYGWLADARLLRGLRQRHLPGFAQMRKDKISCFLLAGPQRSIMAFQQQTHGDRLRHGKPFLVVNLTQTQFTRNAYAA